MSWPSNFAFLNHFNASANNVFHFHSNPCPADILRCSVQPQSNESSRDGQAVSGSPEYRRCCSEIELIIQLHNEHSDNHSSGASVIDKRPSYTSSSHDIELDTRNRPLDECLCRNRTSRPPTTHLHPLKWINIRENMSRGSQRKMRVNECGKKILLQVWIWKFNISNRD